MRPLNDPALRQNDKTVRVRPLHDFNLSTSRGANHRCRLCSRVATISKDTLDEREAGTGQFQKIHGGMSVLNVGRKHDDVQKKSERVDEDMALASPDLLACVVVLRVQGRAPF